MSTLMSYAVLHPIHHKHASRALIHINAFTVSLRRREVTLSGTATTADEAIALEKAGVDVIAASGFEAGGHRGSFFAAV